MKILNEINSAYIAFEQKKKQLTAELLEEFPKIFAPLFNQCPRLAGFWWSQYTPYFNDGDTCEFSSHASYAHAIIYDEEGNKIDTEYIENSPLDEVSYVILKSKEEVDECLALCKKLGYTWFDKTNTKVGNRGYRINPHYDSHLSSTLKDIQLVLGEIPNDMYRDLFGDHVKVSVYADGTINVKEYDHD